MTQYSRYAIGEVLLIMVGIFMALQLQNWNESRKDENAYLKNLEQIYNGLIGDQLVHQSQKVFHYGQIHNIDSLLQNLNSIDPKDLPVLLIQASLEDIDQPSLISDHFKKLSGANATEKRNELTRNLSSYNNLFDIEYSFNNEDVENLFKELSLEFPFVIFNFLYSGEIMIEKDYTDQDVEILNTPEIKKKIRSILTNLKNQHQHYAAIEEHQELLAISLISQIKLYYPEVELIYSNVGIIGTAISGWDSDGARSTPMIRINKAENIWSVQLELSEGLVKFRCNDAWFQDWGGDDFPNGKAIYKGGNIAVLESGLYEVTLKINEEVYEFKRIEN